MKDASIVILDEAIANIDPENGKELMDAVDALTKENSIEQYEKSTENRWTNGFTVLFL